MIVKNSYSGTLWNTRIGCFCLVVSDCILVPTVQLILILLPPPFPTSSNHYFMFISTLKKKTLLHRRENMWNLSFCVRLILLSILICSSIPSVINVRIPFFLRLSTTPLCIYITEGHQDWLYLLPIVNTVHFTFFRYIPCGGTDVSYRGSSFSFLRNFHIILRNWLY